MVYSKRMKVNVIALREKGGSINSIALQTGLAKSTVSVWVRGVVLPRNIQLKLRDRQLKGWKKGHAAVQARRSADQTAREKGSLRVISQLSKKWSRESFQLYAALLYWCEGGKQTNDGIRFANSDPLLVQSFLQCLRAGFEIDESKFRILVHLHEYHDPDVQLVYWSEITGIPSEQFMKSYVKPHTGKRKKKGYPGCISVRYSSSALVLTLQSLYYSFAESIKGA